MFLNKIIFICYMFLLVIDVKAQAENVKYDEECDLVLLYSNISTQKCLKYYSEKLNNLSVEKKKQYEDSYKKAKIYEMFSYLFMEYPKPKVLFSKLIKVEELNKENKNDMIGQSEIKDYYSNFRSYDHSAYSYDILVAMLTAQKKLNDKDKYMLAISKQRSQCLHKILNNLKEEEAIPASTIINKCYINVGVK